MSAYRTGKRRFRRYLVAWGVVALVGAMVFWQFQRQHESGIRQVLDRNLAAQKLSIQAVQAQYKNSIATYFEEHVLRPETLALFREAQQAEARQEARAQLLTRLQPAYDSMSARGIELFHLHLPDSRSLLRLHQPDHYGDDLSSLRPSVRFANSEIQAVHGFEAGLHDAGFRSVFPVLDESGTHLGSAEFSVPFSVLLDDLQALESDRSFRVVVNGEVQNLSHLDTASGSFQPCAGLDQLMQLDASVDGETDSALILMMAQLDRRIAEQPALWRQILGSEPSALRLDEVMPELTIAQVPLLAPDGSITGWLLSCGRDPALAQLDTAFWTNSLVIALGVLLFGLGGQTLIRLTSTKLAERQRLDLLTRSLGQGLYATNTEGVVTEVNPRACDLLGYTPEQIVGQKAHHFFHVRSATEADKDACPLMAATDCGERFTGERHFRKANGEIIEVSVTSMPLTEQEGSVTLFDDISRHKTNERKLQQIAHYDALTGLPNRVLLADRLGLAMARARRSHEPLALAFVDLDGFKEVNDNHGHAVGDELLLRLAKRMKDCLRETDTVARLGGDEFAVVMTDMAVMDDYLNLLDRLLRGLAEPDTIQGHRVQISASIGVTLYPQPGDIDADQLLRQADHAMYQAKQAGKNRYEVFDLERETELQGHREQAERVRVALEKEEFLLYFQPKVNMASGKVVGAEALIRWQHPDRGLLMPAAFLPTIARHSQEIELGRWVLRRALAQMLVWQRAGLRLPVSVNIAGDHLKHPEFIPELEQLLKKYKEVDPKYLQLEIVESTALDNIVEVGNILEECTRLGVTVALDDFGTGYSSLTYLKRLPTHALKVDQSFVEDMLRDPDDLAILDGVTKLAEAFRLSCVAEGVSSVHHGRVLLQLGCEVAQGYAIARPMPPAAMVEWAANWKAPKEWSQVQRLGTSGLELLYAEVEQRAWVSHLVAYLQGAIATPPASLEELRLARLLKDKGPMRIASAPSEQLKANQKAMQDLAHEMIRLSAEKDVHVALTRLPEVEARRDEVVAQLRSLSGSTALH